MSFKVEENLLNIYNIVEYSCLHPVFNANALMSIPIDPQLTEGKSPGNSLVYDGTQFILAPGGGGGGTGIPTGSIYGQYLYWGTGSWLVGGDDITIGSNAGENTQGTGSVAIGKNAGNTYQKRASIAIGWSAGENLQGPGSVAIGYQAGMTGQGENSVAIGYQAGMTGQGVNSIAIGYQAALPNQSNGSIAINSSGVPINAIESGLYISPIRQANGSSYIMYDVLTKELTYSNSGGASSTGPTGPAGSFSPTGTNFGEYIYWNTYTGSPGEGAWTIGSENITLGYQAGMTGQKQYSVAMGYQAGMNNQATGSIAIGYQAGILNQGTGAYTILANTFRGNSISIGNSAGTINQSTNAISIGTDAGKNNQRELAISIGLQAGMTGQNASSIAIGHQAGQTSQQNNSIAIGQGAGNFNQQNSTIAIGYQAGNFGQQDSAVSIGLFSGFSSQQSNAIAIGNQAGYLNQQSNAIAIGNQAGYLNQGAGSIAIGLNAVASFPSQIANSTVINSSGTPISAIETGLYMAPIRNSTGPYVLFYNDSTKEITYSLTGFAGPSGTTLPSGTNFGEYLYWNSYSGASGEGTWTVGSENITLGYQAGMTGQNSYAIAIGYQPGMSGQGTGSIAIGYQTAQYNQQDDAIALGQYAGQFNQQNSAIAIGQYAGYNNQQINAIAIGAQAGQTQQGTGSIAIGYNSTLAYQGPNSTVINSSGNAIAATGNALYMSPIRNATSPYVLLYDYSTKEITYSLTGPAGSTSSGNGGAVLYFNPNEDVGIDGELVEQYLSSGPITKTTIISNGIGQIGEDFITPQGYPLTTYIPAGNWTFNIWCKTDVINTNNNYYIYVEIYEYIPEPPTLTLLGTSSIAYFTSTALIKVNPVWEQTTTVLTDSTSRILCKLIVGTTDFDPIEFTASFQANTPTCVNTTFAQPIQGTANQILVNNSISPQVGGTAVISLPDNVTINTSLTNSLYWGDNMNFKSTTTSAQYGYIDNNSGSDIRFGKMFDFDAPYNLNTSSVIIGQGAAPNNSGVNCIIMGSAGVASNKTTGDNCIIIGGQGCGQNVIGDDNTIIGRSQVINGNLSGIRNFFFGANCARNTHGSSSSNTAIGVNTLENLGVGDFNLCIGGEAGKGAYNNPFSGIPGRDLWSQNYNVIIGGFASWSWVNGSGLTYLGSFAGFSVSGSNNTLIGYAAGFGPGDDTDSNTNNNTLIGYESGYTSRYGASNNVCIGHQAGYNMGTGTSNVCIGYQAGYNINSDSNKLYISNSNTATPLIYGDFANNVVTINNSLKLDSVTFNLATPGTPLTRYLEGTVTCPVTYNGAVQPSPSNDITINFVICGKSCTIWIPQYLFTGNGLSNTFSINITGSTIAPSSNRGYQSVFTTMDSGTSLIASSMYLTPSYIEFKNGTAYSSINQECGIPVGISYSYILTV